MYMSSLPKIRMRSIHVAYLIVIHIVSTVVSSTIDYSYVGSYNYSFFNSLNQYSQMDAVCYVDSDHPAIGYIEKFSSDFIKKISTVDYYTAGLNFSNSLIYFDVSTKSLKQKLQLVTDGSGTSISLFDFTVEKTVNGYVMSFNFEKTECSLTLDATPLSVNVSKEINVTCASPASSISLTAKISGYEAYECIFQETKTPGIVPSKAAPISGLRIDWNASILLSENWRSSLSQDATSMPNKDEIDYWTNFNSIQYSLVFGQGDNAGKPQRVALSLFNLTTLQKDANCLALANTMDYKCKTCKPNYMLIGGGCLCNRGSTIDTVNLYKLKMYGTTPETIFEQTSCRGLGTGLGSDAKATCESEIDTLIKRNLTLTFNKSSTAGSDLNVSYTLENGTLGDILNRCSDQKPQLKIYLVYQGKPQSIGQKPPGVTLVQSINLEVANSRMETIVPLAGKLDVLQEFCTSYHTTPTSTLYECQLRSSVGPGTSARSRQLDHRVNFLQTTTVGGTPSYDMQVLNLNATRYFFGSVYKTDPNARLRVYTYNRSDESLASLPFDQRFNLTEMGSVEKDETLRLTFDLANSSLNSRYTISDYKITALISDSSTKLPYVGLACNSSSNDGSYFQRLVLDCIFSLKNNVTLTVDLKLRKRDVVVSPETLNSTHVLMFEVFQKKTPIVLAGLSYTATIVVIILTLISMTALICYLAVKAGAVDNLNLGEIKDNLKGKVDKLGEMFHKNKKDDSKLKDRLLDNEDEEKNDSKERKKKAAKQKKRKTSDDEEEEMSNIFKKNDISGIQTVKEKDRDSILEKLGKQIKKTGGADDKSQIGKEKFGSGVLDDDTPHKKSRLMKEKKRRDESDEQDEEVPNKRKGNTEGAVDQKNQSKALKNSRVEDSSKVGKPPAQSKNQGKEVSKIADFDSEDEEDNRKPKPKNNKSIQESKGSAFNQGQKIGFDSEEISDDAEDRNKKNNKKKTGILQSEYHEDDDRNKKEKGKKNAKKNQHESDDD